ncbi:hypothetical protein L596_001086 [Steinernema carpocapsae]|uniref:Uncharacterized protein n=1 Tax=Steinernema carpocapsae TaxID=34508 RepID=A0A4U8UMK5_STECR|nr:hypothetical protein L596_001086 [Steinernema carpocapsae]
MTQFGLSPLAVYRSGFRPSKLEKATLETLARQFQKITHEKYHGFTLGSRAYQPGADERPHWCHELLTEKPEHSMSRSVLGGPGADVLRGFWYRSGLSGEGFLARILARRLVLIPTQFLP